MGRNGVLAFSSGQWKTYEVWRKGRGGTSVSRGSAPFRFMHLMCRKGIKTEEQRKPSRGGSKSIDTIQV